MSRFTLPKTTLCQPSWKNTWLAKCSFRECKARYVSNPIKIYKTPRLSFTLLVIQFKNKNKLMSFSWCQPILFMTGCLYVCQYSTLKSSSFLPLLLFVIPERYLLCGCRVLWEGVYACHECGEFRLFFR